MKLSARNILVGQVTQVTMGAVSGTVTISVGEQSITANITVEAIKELGLTEGVEAYAIIKASNVMFAAGAEPIKNISARNQLTGVVGTIRKGAVNGHVTLELPDETIVTGSITNTAIDELGLQVDAPAVAVIKSTDVIIGVD